jgi:hypothetical protein
MSLSVRTMVEQKTAIWAAPTYSQAMVCLEEAQRVFPPGTAEVNLSRMTMTMGLGRIYFRSLDKPDTLRGLTADLIVIDEAQDSPASAYARVLRPMLMDTLGDAWIIGTPKGRNWFWRGILDARTRSDSISWQAPTLGAKIEYRSGRASALLREPHPLENSHMANERGWAEMQAMFADPQMSELDFRQEVLCEFLAEGAGVFIGHHRNATAEYLKEPEPGHTYVFGVDWGKKNDATWVHVLDADTCREVDLFHTTRIDYATQVMELKALNARWQPQIVVAESNSMGEPLIDVLAAEGLPMLGWAASNRAKADVINDLALAFERDELKIIPDELLLMELDAFERERLPSGAWKFGAPEGVHDDSVIALALAWHAVRRGQAFYAPSIW